MRMKFLPVLLILSFTCLLLFFRTQLVHSATEDWNYDVWVKVDLSDEASKVILSSLVKNWIIPELRRQTNRNLDFECIEEAYQMPVHTLTAGPRVYYNATVKVCDKADDVFKHFDLRWNSAGPLLINLYYQSENNN